MDATGKFVVVHKVIVFIIEFTFHTIVVTSVLVVAIVVDRLCVIGVVAEKGGNGVGGGGRVMRVLSVHTGLVVLE